MNKLNEWIWNFSKGKTRIRMRVSKRANWFPFFHAVFLFFFLFLFLFLFLLIIFFTGILIKVFLYLFFFFLDFINKLKIILFNQYFSHFQWLLLIKNNMISNLIPVDSFIYFLSFFSLFFSYRSCYNKVRNYIL